MREETMSEQTNVTTSEDLTKTTATADIELKEEELNRVSGGTNTDLKMEPFK